MTDFDDVDVRATIGLPASPESPRHARRFVSDFCRAADLDDEVCQTAALLVSELVTNAVVHGRSRATLTAERPPGLLRLAVEDSNPTLPAVGDAPPLDRESGRGLQIVAALATRWGIERTADGGKAVWFELALG